MSVNAERVVDETEFHLRDLQTALLDMEDGDAGNGAHNRAIRAAIRAVEWLLIEQRNAAKMELRAAAA